MILKALHTHGKPMDCVGVYRPGLIDIFLTDLPASYIAPVRVDNLHLHVIPSIALPTLKPEQKSNQPE